TTSMHNITGTYIYPKPNPQRNDSDTSKVHLTPIGDSYDTKDTNCICPQTSGWTSEQLLEHQKKMNISGEPLDCFCLGNRGYILIKLKPDTNNNRPTMDCFCPRPPGWSTEQYNLLLKQKNFSGRMNDCFCSSPLDIPPELRNELISSKLSPPEDEKQSHLSVVSHDGALKEVHLGALHVFLH
ncbi:hypothetical protein L9F63_019783, partial [Diploptera punctata]